jgi:deoxyribose-phosphate aldolase
MSWPEPEINAALARRLMSLVDLTSLNDTDTEASLPALFEKAQNALGHVASVCVLPRFAGLAKAAFTGTPVRVCTVANFPAGTASVESVLRDINAALEAGADEIDVVFPYTRYLTGDHTAAHDFVETCKAACGEQAILKAILETGALGAAAVIEEASAVVIDAGADFIKTSTGKIAVGATPTAATAMLTVIQQTLTQTGRQVGFKASGGIREVKDAARYLVLADEVLGKAHVTPATFRIGASLLVDRLLEV